jgi:hypothetical protein
MKVSAGHSYPHAAHLGGAPSSRMARWLASHGMKLAIGFLLTHIRYVFDVFDVFAVQ